MIITAINVLDNTQVRTNESFYGESFVLKVMFLMTQESVHRIKTALTDVLYTTDNVGITRLGEKS